MADKYPRDFTVAADAQITLETEFYSHFLKSGVPNGDYRLVLSQIAAALEAAGFVKIYGSYASDEDAAADSVPIDGTYELTTDNDYGIPTANGGVLKRRKE